MHKVSAWLISSCALTIRCLCQDGRSSALTAPNGPAQSALVSAALASAAAGAEQVACVSVHGTGAHLITQPFAAHPSTFASLDMRGEHVACQERKISILLYFVVFQLH